MSQIGINKAAKVFSLMQETRRELLKMGTEDGEIDKQDIMLGQMLEDGKNSMRNTFAKLSLMEEE